MNAPRATASEYIDMLIGSPEVVTATEVARVQPIREKAPSHDAFTRLLHRLEPDPETLWLETSPQIRRDSGVLVIDDTTLDKPYARQMTPVTRHWSGKQHAVVQSINLVSLVWTDGDRIIPCDYRIYHKTGDGLTKNDHFAAMMKTAHERGFQPECVLFDGWYASMENLKHINGFGWKFLTRLKSNRLVRLAGGPPKAVAQQPISETGTEVWLPGFRVDPSVSDGRPKRRRDALGDQRPGHGRVKTADVVGVELDNRRISSRLETKHGDRRVSVPLPKGPIQPYRDGHPGFCPIGMASLYNRRQLVRGQTTHHS